MTSTTNKQSIEYVPPAILDLGEVTELYGACVTGDSFGGCVVGSDNPSACYAGGGAFSCGVVGSAATT